MQKEIEEYSGEIFLFDVTQKSFKVKTSKARKINGKYEITSIYKITITKEKLE